MLLEDDDRACRGGMTVSAEKAGLVSGAAAAQPLRLPVHPTTLLLDIFSALWWRHAWTSKNHSILQLLF